jgi:hypothetical protein
MPHTRRDKDQVEDIPEDRTARNTMRDVSQSDARTPALDHDGRGAVDERMKTD